MRKIINIFILVFLNLLLCCGCAQSRQIENQAYVIVLGIDAADNGGITLTAKIPVLSSQGGDKPSSGETYRQFSATGTNYNTALKNLHSVSPRNLNLSQLELLVFSTELTEINDFRSLIEDISQTERLYTASKAVICNEKAMDFVANLQPAIGSRLSLDVPAIFENYTDQGLIPESTLANLYYLTATIYSDPMVANAVLSPDSAAAKSTEENSGSSQSISFIGSSVFSNGIRKLTLNPEETILTNLLRNEVKYFRFEVDDKIVEAAPYAPVSLSVDLAQSPVKLSVKLRLNIGTQEDMPDENRIKDKMTEDIHSLIRKAQQNGAEPFGFANSAASKFPTFAKWLEYGWKEAYEHADIDISVSLARWDA